MVGFFCKNALQTNERLLVACGPSGLPSLRSGLASRPAR